MEQQRELNRTLLLDLQDEVLLHVISKLDYHSKKALRASNSRLCTLLSSTIHTLRFRKVHMKGLVTVPVAQRLLRLFPTVTRLDVDYTYTRAKSFMLMAARWAIRDLRIGHYTNSSNPAVDYDYEWLAVAFPRLQSLEFHVDGWRWNPPALSVLSHLTTLTSLVIPNSLSNNSGLTPLAPLTAFGQLHTFSADNSQAFKNISVLTQLEKLRSLHLTIGEDGDSQVRTIASLRHLTSLQLVFAEDAVTGFHFSSLGKLSLLSGLSSLILKANTDPPDLPSMLPESATHALALGLSSLTSLGLLHVYPEGGAAGLPLDGFKALRTLWLHVRRPRPFETAGLHSLLPLPNLQRLELYDSSMDADNTLLNLVSLQTSLQALVLPLSSQVHMEGLEALSALGELRALSLYCQQDNVAEMTGQLVEFYIRQNIPHCRLQLTRCPNLNRGVIKLNKAFLDKHTEGSSAPAS